MGKKRIVKKSGNVVDKGVRARLLAKLPKKKLAKGILNIEATFNNTKVLLADESGNTVMWATSGSLGFSGAKKSTPFAAAKVAELIGDKASQIGVKEVDVVVRGIGAGRESAIRAFVAKGIAVNTIRDETPIAHNGPRRKRPRRN